MKRHRSHGLKARLLVLVLLVVGLLYSSQAFGQVNRYGLIIGNNHGAVDEEPLRYAESDATKVRDVLTLLGEFRPENTVLLLGKSGAEIQRVLISLNARIRAENGGAQDAMLFVYYSGHADARALHTGRQELELGVLKRLVQGSAADFRLLALDACRSGALTRVKGATPVAPFDIHGQEQLAGEGVAFLTSSASGEDAQESDALKGSFFTHYLVSGLRGAADKNGNGAISLEEAYDYAYQHTLRASSRSWHGVQHPTFRFDLKGKGVVPLTFVGKRQAAVGMLAFPSGRSYLVFSKGMDGPLVAEVGLADTQRELALEAGEYFVRGRGSSDLVEGTASVQAGQLAPLPEADFERVEYARLVRKGGDSGDVVHGPWLGYRLRQPLWDGATLCQGARVGYTLALSSATLSAAVGGCRSSFDNSAVSAAADELDLELGGRWVFDFPVLSVGLGASGGVSVLRQSFETTGVAPARNSLAGHFGPALTVTAELGAGFYGLVQLTGRAYLFRQLEEDSLPREAEEVTRTVFTLDGVAGVGKYF